MHRIGIFGGWITMSRPFRFLLIIASALILLSADVRAQNVTTKVAGTSPSRTIIGPIRGVDYGPFHTGETPSGPCNLPVDASQDSSILATMGNVVRVYSVAQTPCDYYNMVLTLLANGLNVVPSAYLCAPSATCVNHDNLTEVNNLISLVHSLSANDLAKIPFVVVGNEAVSFNNMTWGDNGPNDLKPFVLQVKNALPSVKVTTAEIYYQYLGGTVQPCVGNNGQGPTDIGNTVDLIFVNIYPYSETPPVPLNQALTCILNVYDSLNTAYPLSKPIVISETGWPSLASVNDQQTYWQSVITAAKQNNIEYFGFEAFDEAWKSPPAVEATWGLWYANRQPKAPAGIVSFNPPTFTASPASGSAPLAVTFSASGFPPPPTSYTINFGDSVGQVIQDSCIGISAVQGGQGGIQCFVVSGSASHIYTAAGSYTATLFNSNNIPLASATITVNSPSAESNRIYPFAPSGGSAPLEAATFGSQTIPALRDVPRQTLEVPFAGSNATVPTISSFTASPASISPFDGASATLSWSVASATSLSISGLGAVTGTSVQVNPSQTTTYILTASNAQGSMTAQTTVIVAGYRWRRVDPLSR
jgi:exo-beta-1,3-glucanase (GH17 family)/PKD repeat protein